jgi:hypothetical protein
MYLDIYTTNLYREKSKEYSQITIFINSRLYYIQCAFFFEGGLILFDDFTWSVVIKKKKKTNETISLFCYQFILIKIEYMKMKIQHNKKRLTCLKYISESKHLLCVYRLAFDLWRFSSKKKEGNREVSGLCVAFLTTLATVHKLINSTWIELILFYSIELKSLIKTIRNIFLKLQLALDFRFKWSARFFIKYVTS